MSDRPSPLEKEVLVVPEHFFGRVEVQSRIRREGLHFIGEGRSLHYDRDGKLTKDSGWRPTGVDMTAPDEATATQIEVLCARP